MRRSSRTLSLGLPMLLLGGLLPMAGLGLGTAAADDGWTPSVKLSGRQDAWQVGSGSRPSTAVTPGGTALVVWSDRGRIRMARRQPGSTWSDPRVLHVRRHPRLWGDMGPQIGVDPAGTQTLVWTQGRSIRAMQRLVGEKWGSQVKIDVTPGIQRIVSPLHLAVGDDGTVLVTYWRGRVPKCRNCFDDFPVKRVRADAVLRHPRERWNALGPFAGPLKKVHGWSNPSLGPGIYDLVLPPIGVVYSSGMVTTAWSRPGYMETGPVYVRTRQRGQPWQDRIRLSTKNAKAEAPLLTATSWGQVTAGWSNHRGVWSRTKLGAGAWAPPQRIARRRFDLVGLDGDETGAATALLRGREAIYVRERSGGGAWGDRTRIGRAGSYPTLVVNNTGEAVAAWGGDAGGGYASYRNSADPWTRAVPIGGGGVMLSAAVGLDDTATVAAFQIRGSNNRWMVLRGTVHPG